jgi:hypothetical protein
MRKKPVGILISMKSENLDNFYNMEYAINKLYSGVSVKKLFFRKE